MALNDRELSGMAKNGHEWTGFFSGMTGNGRVWMEIGNIQKWPGMDDNVPEWPDNDQEWSEITRVGWEWSGNDQKWPEVTGDCQE